MAKFFEALDDKLIAFIEAQPMFFIASAVRGGARQPLAEGARCLPRARPHLCAYLDIPAPATKRPRTRSAAGARRSCSARSRAIRWCCGSTGEPAWARRAAGSGANTRSVRRFARRAADRRLRHRILPDRLRLRRPLDEAGANPNDLDRSLGGEGRGGHCRIPQQKEQSLDRRPADRLGRGVNRTAAIPSNAAGVLTIDLGALAGNWRELARRAAPGRCAAVIKADAYGVGIEAAAPALHAAGCRVFFVAHASEGARARAVLPPESRIYVLNGLESETDPAADYAAQNLAPVIGSPDELARWAAFAAGRRPPPSALHLDTGMNRLGFASLSELRTALDRCGAVGAELLMSHFVASDKPVNPLNASRCGILVGAVAAGIPRLPREFVRDFSARRPLMISRGRAMPSTAAIRRRALEPMRTVVTLEVPIPQIRFIERARRRL